jgi:hypothetical protein
MGACASTNKVTPDITPSVNNTNFTNILHNNHQTNDNSFENPRFTKLIHPTRTSLYR